MLASARHNTKPDSLVRMGRAHEIRLSRVSARALEARDLVRVRLYKEHHRLGPLCAIADRLNDAGWDSPVAGHSRWTDIKDVLHGLMGSHPLGRTLANVISHTPGDWQRLKRCKVCTSWFVDLAKNRRAERCSRPCTDYWWSRSRRRTTGPARWEPVTLRVTATVKNRPGTTPSALGAKKKPAR